MQELVVRRLTSQRKWSGKSLVPDPERASLITRAFEELATGRFTKQEVIARMAEAGLRTRRGLVLSPQSFGQMMRNAIYIGKVESPASILRRRADLSVGLPLASD